MPTSKLSTSNKLCINCGRNTVLQEHEPGCSKSENPCCSISHCDRMQSEYAIDSLTQERDHYKGELERLLSAVHRDGGQYTTLVGQHLSISDAITKIQDTYRENASLWIRNKQLSK